jgi:SAM-dependent methyltransferase
MPDLSTPVHTNMLRSHSLPRRLYRAVRKELARKGPYGMEWGDPESVPPLKYVKDHWVTPYVDPHRTGVEIGPGGGRWTRFLIGFERLYVVDYHQELLDELRKTVDLPNMVFIKNNGTDFPSVPDTSIDFLFSFGTFVHLDRPVIEAYLANIGRILKKDGNAVVHYSDKNKIMARDNATFSDNDPERMRKLVEDSGFRVLEEDLTTLWHSSLIRFAP